MCKRPCSYETIHNHIYYGDIMEENRFAGDIPERLEDTYGGLHHMTQLNVVIVKTQHDQDSIDKVNAIQTNLYKHRVDVILPFLNLNLYCY